MNQSDPIPAHKRAELNQTETGRQAVRVIDILHSTNECNLLLLKECATLLSEVASSRRTDPLEKLTGFIDSWLTPL
jgi:hypothetical protein